jgi:hypothetical protein
VITKSKEHEIDQAGKRLLRKVLEPLNCVVNDVQEDYAIDCNVQVFDEGSPTGSWFHIQLKSSASSEYSVNRTFVSQRLSIDHARHYAFELREPIFLIHIDVTSETVYWHAPQLDQRLAAVLRSTKAKFIRVRIPTRQQLPGLAKEFFASLDNIRLALAARELVSAPARSFAEALEHLPNQEEFQRAFLERADTVRLQKTRMLINEGKFAEAKSRVAAVLSDPDSTVEIRFWAEIQSEAIDVTETVHSGKPQAELSKVLLAHAKSIQKVTAKGPNHLKFYALIAKCAAELEALTHEYFTVFLATKQHLERPGIPLMAFGLFARRSDLIRRIVSKYNQCVRLARYASAYPSRWMLGRALAKVAQAIGPYLVALRSEGRLDVEEAFSRSALQICKLAAWIGEETGDPEGVVLATLAALTLTASTDSNAFRWANQIVQNLIDPQIRENAFRLIERAKSRWKGDSVEGDYEGDTTWQIIQNIATAVDINLSDENDPLVRSLRIAAKDNSPERVLAKCEHILVGTGAMGPVARKIQRLFNISTAGSKVVHCTLHDFHVEGKDLDTAYSEFKRAHCDSCPDQKPRAEGWEYTEEEQRAFQARHREFVARIVGTTFGPKYADED